MKIVKQTLEETNAYSLFVYAIRSQVTRDYYLRRLRIFFNYINLQSDLTMEERCNYFANKGTNDPSWAFNCIVKFLQYQKERVEKEEITGATLRNFIKAFYFSFTFYFIRNIIPPCIFLIVMMHKYH
jgi:hypothetical protein